MKQSSLKEKIWIYLILFSCIILISLWLFQVVFLNSYYEWYKKRDIEALVNKISKSYDPDTIESLLDSISYENGVCIEIVTDGSTSYSSDHFNRGCMMLNKANNVPKKETSGENEISDKIVKPQKEDENSEMIAFRSEFMNGNKKKDSTTLVNPRFHNQTLIYGLKLDKNVYVFVNASMQPLDATTKILTSQFVFVTIGVLFLSFLIGYLISKKISKPIIKLNKAAKEMAKGEYDVVFETGEHITELNELANTLNYTRNELAGTEELRRELLANISHDLKTPLTMMKAYAEMVRDLSYQDEKKRTEHLNVIIEESDRLNLLVNDILELSRMQSNIDLLDMETFDLSKLMHLIVKRFEILTETENYHFEVIGKKRCMVYADQKKIEQVIYNLIGNAINYTGDDKIVKIKIEDKNEHIRVSIIDTGKGIKPDELNKIWDKYYKSDKKHKRNAYGTGIGLSIVKQILENHGATYGVESEVNHGTTFFFELEKKNKN